MSADLVIASACGSVALRAETDADEEFRFGLFRASRPPEWDLVRLDPALLEQVMRQQFHAQTVSYRGQHPLARFDIIELDGEPIGRIVVDRPGTAVYIVDQAIVPDWRGRGIGTSIMRALMDEAAKAGLPVRLMGASDNDPSLRLYLRLGFVPIASTPVYVELEWKPA